MPIVSTHPFYTQKEEWVYFNMKEKQNDRAFIRLGIKGSSSILASGFTLEKRTRLCNKMREALSESLDLPKQSYYDIADEFISAGIKELRQIIIVEQTAGYELELMDKYGKLFVAVIRPDGSLESIQNAITHTYLFYCE